jgi:hypothetical protein
MGRSHRFRSGAAVVVSTLAGALLAAGPSRAADPPPASIELAQGSVVQIVKTAGNDKGAAFAVDAKGDLLTSQQAVSRSAGLQVTVAGSSRRYTARRLDSDAPPGLVLIRLEGGPRLKPLSFARERPEVTERTWVVPPRALSSRPRGGTVKLPQSICTSGSDTGVLTIGVSRTAGLNGSPVLNDRGAVVGVVRSSHFTTDCDERTLQAVVAERAPQALPALAAPKSSDFPAVPVVVGLLGALLVINIVLFLRRRRGLAALDLGPSPAPAPHPAPRYDDGFDDGADLEIALKPKPGAPAAVPAAADDEIRLR